jgi:hypothetical protein
LATVVLTVVGAGACAQIEGLPDYSAGELPEPDSSTPLARTETSDAAGEVALGEASDDGQVEGDAGPMGDPRPVSGDCGGDGDDAGKATEGGKPSDASLVPDGYVCGPGTCGGCCNTTGDCVGGQSVTTCGLGGRCKDCTSSGACSQGECTTPPLDAAPPPMCVLASCSNSNCAGFPIQGACCKSDQTCGCQWTVFAPCL